MSGSKVFIQKIVFLLSVMVLSACGRYAAPLVPEQIAPVAVKGLEIHAQIQGVNFVWYSPEKQVRGKELKEIDGYRIYRKLVERDADILDPDKEYDLLTTIPDTHLIELKRLQDAAEAEGKPAHRVKVDGELKKFEYTDTGLEPNHTYVYEIVPYNQGDVEGEVGSLIKILFRGVNSEIQLIPYSEFEPDSLGDH